MYLAYYWKALLVFIHMSLTAASLSKKSIGPQSGLVIQPRHTEIEARADSALTYAIMRFNRKSFSETAAALQVGDPARIELLPTFFFNDPLLYHLGTELANEARNANPFGPLYADSLANSLALYLLRNYSTNRVTLDRKSTRLNSSHVRISYAVFCLKKKKN